MAAEHLGISVDELRMVLRLDAALGEGEVFPGEFVADDDGSVAAVYKALAGHAEVDAFFVDLVPVLPPGDRLPLLDERNPRMLHPIDGSVNVAYSNLVLRAQRHRRLIELDAPPIILDNELSAVQRLVERLVEAVRDGNKLGGWDQLGDDTPVSIVAPDPETSGAYDDMVEYYGESYSMIWIDDQRLALARGRRLQVVDMSGVLEREIEIEPWRICSINGSGHLVLCDQIYGDADGDQPWVSGVQILDTQSWQFLDAVPPGVGLYALENDQPEDLFIVDWRHQRDCQLMLSSDRPALGAYSRDGLYALAVDDEDGGLIIEFSTALPLVNLHRLNPDRRLGACLLRDGRRLVASDIDALEDELDVDGSPAIALTPDNRWRYLTAAGTAGENDEVWFRLTFDFAAAAFSPAADHLAIWLADEDEVIILDPLGAQVTTFALDAAVP